MAFQPGRNDPCPCGSGKKYKKCCMRNSQGFNPAGEIREELQDILNEHKFESLDEVNRVIKDQMEKRNHAPMEEFHGLSPHQMHRLLHFPFDSPDVVRFNLAKAVTHPGDAPLTHLFALMVEAIGENGLKATATGNLPRNVGREIAKKYFTPERHEELIKYGDFMSENDIPHLQEVRFVAGKAGFVNKSKGTFIISKKCRQLLDSGRWGEIYEQLFMVFVNKFNWAYKSRLPEIPFIQQAMPFTLFLLNKYGSISRPVKFYSDIFIEAFPMLLQNTSGNDHEHTELIIRIAYHLMTLYTFGEISGVLSVGYKFTERDVVALPLLKRLVSFQS